MMSVTKSRSVPRTAVPPTRVSRTEELKGRWELYMKKYLKGEDYETVRSKSNVLGR